MADEYKNALTKLVMKIREVHKDPGYTSVWGMAMIHGHNYNGPTYEKELREAGDLLGLDPEVAEL